MLGEGCSPFPLRLLFQAANNQPLFFPALYYPPPTRKAGSLATPHKKLPLFTELPGRVILGNLHSYARISVRYRGVWWWHVCSASFLEEFFSETQGKERPGSNSPGSFPFSCPKLSADLLDVVVQNIFSFCSI